MANLRCITVLNHSLEKEDQMGGSSETSASMRTRMPLHSFEENKWAEIYISRVILQKEERWVIWRALYVASAGG